jgi:formate-dependent nitrite reductase membrane component NrfD
VFPSSTWVTYSPDWGWLIVFYFFFGGLAGGCYFLAALIDLLGRAEDRPLARAGYYVVLPCLLISGILLIWDLSRPDRFWHLLIESNTFQPMFKYWSPMSISSWVLLLFSVFAVASALSALSEGGRLSWRWPHVLRPPGIAGRIFAVLGALFGLYVASYTGVLLAVTNRPLWADTPLLGMLLVLSATSISAALMLLLAWRLRYAAPAVFALNRIDCAVIVLQLLVLAAVLITLGPVAQVWWSLWGLLLLLGVVLLGLIVPLLLRWRHRGDFGAATLAVAVLVLVGGFILRTVIVFTPNVVTLPGVANL